MVTRERIAVLGAGGIGGMLAARTGALCVGTERTVAAIRGRGLVLTHGGSESVWRLDAVERLDRPVALLVVAVKAYDLDAALERIDAEALRGTVVLPLLNGLEHVERLRAWVWGLRGDSPQGPSGDRRGGGLEASASARAVPGDPRVASGSGAVVAAGSIGRVEAFSPKPGVVVQRTAGRARVTVASDDLDRHALDAALDPLRVPEVEVVVAAGGERLVLWEKAARLAVLAAATVASGEPVGALRTDESWRPRLDAALDEACAVATADGVPLDPAGQWAMIDALPYDLVTSAARDAAARRPTELDAIAGSVARAARRLGIATPALDDLLSDARARVGAAA